jgi:NAD(P)-dependent dehydrogenase (short-subunit alcohol dehydrogenase family)
VLPYLRAQRSGHIVQVSSLSGVVGFPLLGMYQASKFALEGLTESLAQEVADFGIAVTLLEPGSFRTDWAGSSAVHAAPNPAYDDLRARLDGHERTYHHGDPDASAQYLLQLVDNPNPPLRLMFGRNAVELAVAAATDRIQTWTRWEDAAKAAAGD